jgi:hypothetical protein
MSSTVLSTANHRKHTRSSEPEISALFSSFEGRVADPHHFNADSDPAFHCNADPDPDPVHNQSDVNLRPLVYRPFRAPF